jgi:hypothetical protein
MPLDESDERIGTEQLTCRDLLLYTVLLIVALLESGML